ncbi:hypothetical protein ASPZODRAFT_11693 [Penicilliopsis zonata CBS 506.65]|uniref:Zn(2)-C6 fungal-type domain-containing protein n=1 Tax=Penicilliopsis zonata CBS 506.65 TaxID=1073090 RepID=A0A1L9SUU1_9EURO|nr:hypothetical protein ASPZODRAFT_11693 [Penicilliopsis zonata CBS 506.65]OJJ50847.1 hypothetical protein ASPZODRAFT_11693 [Penicilliopsis zonata CBS 506.65]
MASATGEGPFPQPSVDVGPAETSKRNYDNAGPRSTLCDDSRVATPNSSGSGSPFVQDPGGSRLQQQQNNETGPNEPPKARRVRTGCLTCRERHLKCDETLPRCHNCRKSDRVCRRGMRLNFIDTQMVAPPYDITRPPGTPVTFQDESRYIASEYVGGFERYPPLEPDPPIEREKQTQFDYVGMLGPTTLSKHHLSATGSLLSAFTGPSQSDTPDLIFGSHASQTAFSDQVLAQAPFHPLKPVDQNSTSRSFLSEPEEVLLMQVFVEEIGIWMDSMDPMKHFTTILPFHALEEPMLLRAFMACAARHLFLVNPSYGEPKASYYYDAASRDLLNYLQDPDRDSVLCATTAIILNVYEIMSGQEMHRMTHIAGARALIKECQWDAKSPGLGSACFWLNIGIELMSCLHYNWTLAWDPDTWGVDMDMEHAQPSFAGNEELWTYRVLYICAKIANFRSSIPQFQVLDRSAHDPQLTERFQEWNTYNSWCDQWAKAVPRSMTPLGYIPSWQTSTRSTFPEVWLIKRSSVVARLFYHTARILLAKIHPLESEYSPEMRNIQQIHAHDICGIVAHVKDRGISSISIRCLALAAECLVPREAQQEVLNILDKINRETGWAVETIKAELQETWGWTVPETHPHHSSASFIGDDSSLATSVHALHRPKTSAGVVNPMMATADFSMENHPYQSHYVAPHQHLEHYHHYDTF